MKWHWLLILVVLVVLAGCVPRVISDDRVIKEDELHITRLHRSWNYTVFRFVDTEAGIACWGASGSGISCLPLSETNLDE